jgi:hypothetical protein
VTISEGGLKDFESKNNVQACRKGCSCLRPLTAGPGTDIDADSTDLTGPTGTASSALSVWPGAIRSGSNTSSFGVSNFSLIGVDAPFELPASVRSICLTELKEPILSRIADSEGTSRYPLIYPSTLDVLDMLSAAASFGAPDFAGFPNGSELFHIPPSPTGFSVPRSLDALTRSFLGLSNLSNFSEVTIDGKVMDVEEDCERIMAEAGSFRRPEGEDVYGDA